MEQRLKNTNLSFKLNIHLTTRCNFTEKREQIKVDVSTLICACDFCFNLSFKVRLIVFLTLIHSLLLCLLCVCLTSLVSLCLLFFFIFSSAGGRARVPWSLLFPLTMSLSSLTHSLAQHQISDPLIDNPAFVFHRLGKFQSTLKPPLPPPPEWQMSLFAVTRLIRAVNICSVS